MKFGSCIKVLLCHLLLGALVHPGQCDPMLERRLQNLEQRVDCLEEPGNVIGNINL